MGLQELEKIAEIISKLGENASDSFISYLLFAFGVEMIGYLLGFMAIILVYHTIKRLFLWFEAADDNLALLKRIIAILNINCSGCLGIRDRESLLNTIKSLKEDHDQEF